MSRRNGWVVSGTNVVRRDETSARTSLALEFAAAALRTQPELDIAPGPPPKILPQLTAAFLAGLPARTAEAVEAASTVRRVTEPALAALLGAPTGADRFDDIRELPFVEMTGEGLAFHDVVRDTVAQDLARRDPERHRRYLLRAWRFLNCESRMTAMLDLWQHTADLIFPPRQARSRTDARAGAPRRQWPRRDRRDLGHDQTHTAC